MSKRHYIKLEFEAPAYVLGIASNDRIWKLCWNINQKLELELKTQEKGITEMQGPEIYEDPDTDPDFIFSLFENTLKSRKVPPKAREFRFWMVIKPKKEKTPEISRILTALNRVENISFAVDLSEEKDIKKLIP